MVPSDVEALAAAAPRSTTTRDVGRGLSGRLEAVAERHTPAVYAERLEEVYADASSQDGGADERARARHRRGRLHRLGARAELLGPRTERPRSRLARRRRRTVAPDALWGRDGFEFVTGDVRDQAARADGAARASTRSSTSPRSSATRVRAGSGGGAGGEPGRRRARSSTRRRRAASVGSSSPRRAATTAGSRTATPYATEDVGAAAGVAVRRDEGRGRARRPGGRRARLRADLPSLRDRLRRLAAHAVRPHGERVRPRRPPERRARRLRRAVLAAVRPRPRRRAVRSPTVLDAAVGRRPRRGVQRRRHRRELPQAGSRRASSSSAFPRRASSASRAARTRATTACPSRRSRERSVSGHEDRVRTESTRCSRCSARARSPIRSTRGTATSPGARSASSLDRARASRRADAARRTRASRRWAPASSVPLSSRSSSTECSRVRAEMESGVVHPQEAMTTTDFDVLVEYFSDAGYRFVSVADIERGLDAAGAPRLHDVRRRVREHASGSSRSCAGTRFPRPCSSRRATSSRGSASGGTRSTTNARGVARARARSRARSLGWSASSPTAVDRYLAHEFGRDRARPKVTSTARSRRGSSAELAIGASTSRSATTRPSTWCSPAGRPSSCAASSTTRSGTSSGRSACRRPPCRIQRGPTTTRARGRARPGLRLRLHAPFGGGSGIPIAAAAAARARAAFSCRRGSDLREADAGCSQRVSPRRRRARELRPRHELSGTASGRVTLSGGRRAFRARVSQCSSACS